MSTTPAQRLATLLEDVLGAPLPVRLRAWDGSEAGHPGSPDDPNPPTVIVERRRALRRLLWSPGELGLARAFVSGDLSVDGDVADGLSRFWKLARPGAGAVRPDLRQRVRALRSAAGSGRSAHRRRPPPRRHGSVGGCTAVAGTPTRSATTTTCPTSSTRSCSTRG